MPKLQTVGGSTPGFATAWISIKEALETMIHKKKTNFP